MCASGFDHGIRSRSIRTAKAAVLFREHAGEVKVSLRAKGEVNVARIAARFGGGGHPQAAGFSTAVPYRQLVERLRDLVAQQL